MNPGTLAQLFPILMPIAMQTIGGLLQTPKQNATSTSTKPTQSTNTPNISFPDDSVFIEPGLVIPTEYDDYGTSPAARSASVFDNIDPLNQIYVDPVSHTASPLSDLYKKLYNPNTRYNFNSRL